MHNQKTETLIFKNKFEKILANMLLAFERLKLKLITISKWEVVMTTF